MKKLKGLLGMLVVVFCICVLTKIPVQAAIADEAEDYEMETTFTGNIDGYETRYFKFIVNEKSHVSIKTTCKSYNDNKLTFSIYSGNGKLLMKTNDFMEKYNSVTNTYIGNNGKNLNAGSYYLCVHSGDEKCGWYTKADFSFRIQTENIITLPKQSISSLKALKGSKVKIKYKENSNATGYRIQYSTSEKFSKVKTIYSPDVEVTISGLKKGTRYYFKVCSYTVYDDGKREFGNNSPIKSVKTK